MATARAFYGSVLGLKAGDSWEDKWVEFDVGTCTLALSTVMEGTQTGANDGADALETGQFDEAVAMLKAHGAKFPLKPIDSGGCRFARIEDPDGNHLALHRKHPAPPR